MSDTKWSIVEDIVKSCETQGVDVSVVEFLFYITETNYLVRLTTRNHGTHLIRNSANGLEIWNLALEEWFAYPNYEIMVKQSIL